MISKIAYVVFGAALITSTACQQENKNIESKLDQILQKLDCMPAGGAAGGIGAEGERGRLRGGGGDRAVDHLERAERAGAAEGGGI